MVSGAGVGRPSGDAVNNKISRTLSKPKNIFWCRLLRDDI